MYHYFGVNTSSQSCAGQSLKLLIADGHEIVRLGVRNLLKAQQGWSVVAEAADGRGAVDKAKTTKPEVVILDTGMRTLNGLEAARQIIHNGTGTKVLFLTDNDSDVVMYEALEIGARGFVLKTDPAADLVAAVRALEKNQTFFTAKIDKILLDGFLKKTAVPAPSTPRLTAQEAQMLKLVAEGNTTKGVAILLNLSLKAVEAYRAKVMRRLGCHSTAELVHYCIRNTIIDDGGCYSRGVHDHDAGDPNCWSFDNENQRRMRSTP